MFKFFILILISLLTFSSAYSQTIKVHIKGFDDGIMTTRQKDYLEAVLFAKREAVERAGCKIESFTTIENLILKKSYIESKANAVLLPGYDIVDNGYLRDGNYQITLIGEVLIKNTQNNFNIVNKKSVNNTIKNSLDMTFVYINPGSFIMGSTFHKKDKDEIPHTVHISQGFYMQTTEVTQEQWKVIMGRNPSEFSYCGKNCPVEKVSWFEVQKFIKKLNKQDKTYNYSLPTEAQWEYSVKAGTKTQFYWGNNLDCTKANFGNDPITNTTYECMHNPGKTMHVKKFMPNIWGLYDMHGNVSEFCQDWYAPYSMKNIVDPLVLKNSHHLKKVILRGGAFNDKIIHCRSSNRFKLKPHQKVNNIGFRLIIQNPKRK